MNRRAKFLLALLAIASGGLPAAWSQAVAPPPLAPDVFFTNPEMSEMSLSPSGDWISLLVRNKFGRRSLAILQTNNYGKLDVVASFDQADVRAVEWVDDTRLVFKLATDESNSWYGSRPSGLYEVLRDGGQVRQLVLLRENPLGIGLPSDYRFERTLDDDSGDVIVTRPAHTGLSANADWRLTETMPLRLNARTGHTSDIVGGTPPANALAWAVDGAGVVRLALAQEKSETVVFTRAASGEWTRRAALPAQRLPTAPYDFIRAAVDGKVYLSRSTPGLDSVHALYRADATTGAVDAEPLVLIKGFGFKGRLVEDLRHHKVLGVHFATDAEGTAWFDPAMKDLQARVDARLPGRVNLIDPAICGCATRALVTSYSDHQPAQFFLLTLADGTLAQIGDSRPRIVAAQMADTDFVRIKSSDGHDLPIYVTKPHGKGPWPTVVLVHAGPWERGWDWRWDAVSQFLASRGYLVVKPEFRGSMGYGDQLFESGLQQWGLKMQDDLADAAKWASAQGLADPARICLAGGDYGGYATVIGLARDPKLFRCGIAWSTLADVRRVFDTTWIDASDEQRAYGLEKLMGDFPSDGVHLDVISPQKQAAHVVAPLLLAHADADMQSTVLGATLLRGALQDNHVPVTWIDYPNDAHGFGKPETRIDFFARVDAFLAVNIGSGKPGSDAAAGAPATAAPPP